MKKQFLLIYFLLIAVCGTAGNFEPETESFDRLKIAGNFKVKLRKGETEKIEVINSDEDLEDDRILFDFDKDELEIRIKADTYVERKLEIIITYVNLKELDIRMGCQLSTKEVLIADKLTLECESGGKIKATVDCKKIEASISAGGSIHIDGTADEAKYEISAGGTIGAVNLMAEKVKAKVLAGGEIICASGKSLSIKITSGGNVSYMGDPEEYEQNITLGGKITKMKSN